MLFPLVIFDSIDISEANRLLTEWGHKMGPYNRPEFRASKCHALFDGQTPIAVTITGQLIAEHVGGGLAHLTRDNTVELARLCAARPGLCRVALRLWREFVFPRLGYATAISYQDADLHNGNTYRFDGWACVGASNSGPDQRSGRKGRRKKIWQWPPPAVTLR